MYSHILVPIVFDDDHDTAASFQAALKLANPEAEFTVLHVLDAIPAYASNQIPAELMMQARESTADDLTKAAEVLPKAKTALVTGHAGRQIVNYAASHGVDCIMIASHVPGFENIFLGSTADWVVRHAKCAVHVSR